VNCFNKSPLTAWRGAFRETFKLALEQQCYGKTLDGEMRLARWLRPLPDAENADLIMLGARQGIEASESSRNRWLPLINDFDALRNHFEETVRRPNATYV